MAELKKKLKAEEEDIDETKKNDEKKDDNKDTTSKDDDVKKDGTTPDSKKDDEDASEDKTEDVEDTIVLDSGAVVDENEQPEAEDVENLVTITKDDGTKIYVDKVEAETEEEKKDIYEAIVTADAAEDGMAESVEIGEEITNDINEEIDPEITTPVVDNDEIEEASYIGAACNTHKASLNNSYFIFRTKAGKILAVKAGKLLSKQLKAALLTKIIKKEELPTQETVVTKILAKIGNKFSDVKSYVKKLASLEKANKEAKMKMQKKASVNNVKPQIGDEIEIEGKSFKIVASKKDEFILSNGKHVKAEDLMKTNTKDIDGNEKQDVDSNKQLETFSIKEGDIEDSDYKSTVAVDGKEADKVDEDAVKAAKSKVKNFYNRLPGKSGVGGDPDWALKDFNSLRNKTVASQIKVVRELTKKLKASEAAIEAKNKENEELKEKLNAIEASKKAMEKHSKIEKILKAMNVEDPQQKFVMEKKFASYDEGQLNAVFETLTANVDEETNNINEQMINDELKKEASLLEGRIPALNLSNQDNANDSGEVDYVTLLAEKEAAELSRR